MFQKLANWLIAYAMKTPYRHLGDYMHRHWIVPYADYENDSGFAPLSWKRYPFKRLIQTFGIAARVHNIKRSDEGRDFHDHPWPYLTIILKNGYTEVTPVYKDGMYCGAQRRFYGAGTVLFRRANTFHRLEIAKGQEAWTLFITGRKRQKWGFLVKPEQIKVYYKDYLGIK